MTKEEQRLKPIGVNGIEILRRIVAEGQYGKVNGVRVDTFSAGVVIAIYDKLSQPARDKLVSFPVTQAVSVCFKTYAKCCAKT